jgi:prephenate dehydratase
LPTITDVFASVQSSAATYGVVPFENSSNGSVVFTLDLFADREGKYPDILVDGEVYVSVVHCLLGRKAVERKEEGEEKAASEGAVNHEHSIKEEDGKAVVDVSVEGPTTTTPKSPQSSPSDTQPVSTPSALETEHLPSLDHVTKLYSHPQAWGQCVSFLSSPHLKLLERQDVSSTSRAAQLVSEDVTGTSAAISSKLAADAYGLDVLREGIEDREGNATRFLVLRRRRDNGGGEREDIEEEKLVEEMVKVVTAERIGGEEDVDVEKEVREGKQREKAGEKMEEGKMEMESEDEDDRNEKERDDSVYDYYRIPISESQPSSSAPAAFPAKSQTTPALTSSPRSKHTSHKTLITFTISHSNPGALAASLSVFSKHGLNLTSINTRPSGVENWNYIFFVELQGRREDEGKGEVNMALRELGSVCRGWRWLGSWENNFGAVERSVEN